MQPPVNPLLDVHLSNNLIWFEEAGFGYFEVPEAAQHYDGEYFARYAAQATSTVGIALMNARANLVQKWAAGRLVDVGIGSGAFLEERYRRDFTGDKGFDVNPIGIDWLKRRGAFGDLYAETWPVATFWDALEHIRRPDLALAQVEFMAFVALPIFTGVEHVLRSKHYRRDEHFWYFTRRGFVAWAKSQGFDVVDIVATETALGREDVETFVLRRR